MNDIKFWHWIVGRNDKPQKQEKEIIVKIIKCTSPTSWYVNKIGNYYSVIEDKIFGFYQYNFGTTGCRIDKNDCEIIKLN